MLREESDIIVAGGGVIGVCVALRPRSEGRDVLFVDRNEPGSGTSSGNAGLLATYECVPLGTPSVLKSLPRLLFDANSPLSISLTALPQLTPWLARFARASFQDRARRSAVALAKLLSSLQAYEPLLERAYDRFFALSAQCTCSAAPRDTRQGVRIAGKAIELRVGTLIIALGAWSADLARQLGDRIPLETERGYHVEFPTESPVLSRSVCPVEYGFYLTPMAGRLRAAGTVELSSLRRLPVPVGCSSSSAPHAGCSSNLGPAQSRWLGFDLPCQTRCL